MGPTLTPVEWVLFRPKSVISPFAFTFTKNPDFASADGPPPGSAASTAEPKKKLRSPSHVSSTSAKALIHSPAAIWKPTYSQFIDTSKILNVAFTLYSPLSAAGHQSESGYSPSVPSSASPGP